MKPSATIAGARHLLGVGDDFRLRQEIENGGRQILLGEIVRAGEGAAGIAVHRFEALEMRGLGGARGVGRLYGFGPRSAVSAALAMNRQLAMIERKPGFPLRVRDAGSALQRLAERRQLVGKIGIFRAQCAQRGIAGGGAGHVAGEMHHRVAIGDVDVKRVERAAALVLEILLHLHFDIGTREVGAQLIAIGAEFIRNGREKNLRGRRHECAPPNHGRLRLCCIAEP